MAVLRTALKCTLKYNQDHACNIKAGMLHASKMLLVMHDMLLLSISKQLLLCTLFYCLMSWRAVLQWDSRSAHHEVLPNLCYKTDVMLGLALHATL